MKTLALSLASTALLLGIGIAAFADTQPTTITIQGKDRPILLARMTVTATALPDTGA